MINNKVLKQTKYHLIKVNILVVTSFIVLFLLFIYGYFKVSTYHKIDQELREDSKEVALNLTDYGMYADSINIDPRNIIYIYNGDNLLFYTHNAYFDKTDMSNKNSYEGIFTKKEDGYTFRGIKVKINNYTLYVIRSIDSELYALSQLMIIFIIGFSIAILGTYLISIYLTKKSLRNIEMTWEKQALFIQDASHELRTPLTVVSSKLESMLKNPNNTITDEIENIADAMKETRRLRKMVNDLLSLTKEDSITKLNIKKIDITELTKGMISDYEELALIQNKNFECEYNLINDFIYTDENKLKQLLIIFIDNAFKYTNEKDKIKIKFNDKNNNLNILIEDSGIGIKKEEIPFIFDRFYRSNDIRDKDISGSGIGLSIAKMIILNLEGKMSVKSTINQGTEFNIIIPLKYK